MWHLAPLFLLLPAAGNSHLSFKGALHDKIIWMDLDLPESSGKVNAKQIDSAFRTCAVLPTDSLQLADGGSFGE